MNYFRSKRFLDTLQDWEASGVSTGEIMEDYLPRMASLLNRLSNPQERYISILVGGTNGKGTVSSLLAALLRGFGHQVGLYTSPHLHTIRERIQINGEVVAKDSWAEGVTFFYEKSRDFEKEGYGSFSKFEALTALAAYLFSSKGVDYGIFEVGLGGRYDATNALNADIAILTTIDLDHVEILGETLQEITAEKFQISRRNRPLYTLGSQAAEVLTYLQEQSFNQGVCLNTIGKEDFANLFILDDFLDRPKAYFQNARLATSVASSILGSAFSRDLAKEIALAHQWPGRFEVVRKNPWILLDGAHNLAAAQELVKDLGEISRNWTFVLGINTGHDVEGIIQALYPVAKEFVLTCSGHPRAISETSLCQFLSKEEKVWCEPESIQAIKRAVSGLGKGDHLCVTGSLYLVAQAREVLDLPREQDTFSEEVILESLRCVEMACKNLDIEYTPISDDRNVVRLSWNGRPVYFLRNKHPFNDYVTARLAEDKAYQNELFLRQGIQAPYTLEVFNPLADARFERYRTHPSVEAIVTDVEQKFSYPLVVKRNRGSMAERVYLETNHDALEKRLHELCEDSGRFENVLLIQEFVSGPEYRIVASEDRLLIAYEKKGDMIYGEENLNPLHQTDGQAVKVKDPELIQSMKSITKQVAKVLDLGFYAIDLILGKEGFTVLEVNPNPICFFYNSDNGRSDFIQIYEELFRYYLFREDFSEKVGNND